PHQPQSTPPVPRSIPATTKRYPPCGTAAGSGRPTRGSVPRCSQRQHAIESADVAARTDRRRILRELRAGMPGKTGRSADTSTGVFDTFARNIEVAALNEQQFVHLLETLRILDDAKAGYQLRNLSTDT